MTAYTVNSNVYLKSIRIGTFGALYCPGSAGSFDHGGRQVEEYIDPVDLELKIEATPQLD